MGEERKPKDTGNFNTIIEYIKTIGNEIPNYTKFAMEKTYFLLFITSIFLLTITGLIEQMNRNLRSNLIILFLGFAILFSILTTLNVHISQRKNKELYTLLDNTDENFVDLPKEDLINSFKKVYTPGPDTNIRAHKLLLGINIGMILLWFDFGLVLVLSFNIVSAILLIFISYLAVFVVIFSGKP